MLEVLIDNRNGNVWDITDIVDEVAWKTSRIGRPGSLEITFIQGGLYQDAAFTVNSGDIIRFRKDGVNVFYGYVFIVKGGRDEQVKITAYDQLRYLLASDTYVFKGVGAVDVIRRICGDFNLRVGTLDDTGYIIPALVEDGKKLLDIICKVLDLTLIATGKNYVFFDNFGELTLRNAADMLLDFVVGDGSLLCDYEFTRSIDDSYNRIKLVSDNKDTKKREVYIAEDGANMAKWGRLQLYQKINENMNAGQINELLNSLMAVHNREKKTLQVDAMGDPRVRAGCFVPIFIEQLGVGLPFLVDECSHRFSGTDHTMKLELKVI
ncbi:XkdQ/YqbQ family protein [Heliophilum fasciatum]|uniref:YqbQ/XkdQ domain-containing protein n=1 Tax=Heliophilum fasciatum TaxID=35700 RepID=A0A4R2RQT2_9FIRM|nr:hypothetical protein [Heliophilum fasciatum]MCW2277728.1 hypothetical protein [Heliophilum fasciatum]TCP64777.1 hypothetical protein EDD73_108130 [Heliophilum fasciatum]